MATRKTSTSSKSKRSVSSARPSSLSRSKSKSTKARRPSVKSVTSSRGKVASRIKKTLRRVGSMGMSASR